MNGNDQFDFSFVLFLDLIGLYDDKILRTHLKNAFWPNIFVGASFKILNIQQYASGFKLGPTAILNQNPIFETGSV
jgi:hypothetical protein